MSLIGKVMKVMPNLKHLLDELEIHPSRIKLPGPLYDDLMDQAEDIGDEDEND